MDLLRDRKCKLNKKISIESSNYASLLGPTPNPSSPNPSSGLELNEEMLELLEEVSDFNLEARYPDQKFSFHKKCTMLFTKKKLYEIERVKKWLIQRLPSSI